MSTDADPLIFGSQAVYTLTVDNSGPDTALNFVVQDSLPAGVTFVSADNGGVYDGGLHRVDWSIAELESGGSIQLSLVVTIGLPSEAAEVEVFFNGRDGAGAESGLYRLPLLIGTADLVQSFPNRTLLRDQIREGDEAALFLDAGANVILDESDQPVLDGVLTRLGEDDQEVVLSSGGMLVNPNGMALATNGLIYVADPDGIRLSGEVVLPDQTGRILSIDPDSGGQALISEGGLLVNPMDVVVDDEGGLIVIDASAKLIRVDAASGAQELLTQGGFLSDPRSLTIDPDGNLFIADAVAGIIRVEGEAFAQAVLVDINAEPSLVHPDFIDYGLNGNLFVTDSDGSGAVLQFNSETGSLLNQFAGGVGPGFTMPAGFSLTFGVLNEATVIASDTDPDPNNNSFPLFTVVIPPTSTSNTVSINVTETISTASTEVVAPAVMISVIETVSTSDAESLPAVPHISESDVVTLTDVVSVTPAIMISVTESIGVGDSETFPQDPEIEVQDTITLTDSAVVQPAVMINVVETLSTTDTTTPASAAQVGATETVAVAEGVVVDGVAGPPFIFNLFGDGVLVEPAAELQASITRIRLVFSERISDPKGDVEQNDVTNPGNYLLVGAGIDGEFDTKGCDSGVGVGDIAFGVVSVVWDAPSATATLLLDSQTALPAGAYRLFACSDLTDLGGNPLDGDNDGTGGDDFSRSFDVLTENLLRNPNFDLGLEGWSVQESDGSNVIFNSGLDVNGITTSGSAEMNMTAGVAAMELSQCLPLMPGQWYRLGGRLRLSSIGQTQLRPRIKLTWHAAPDCGDEPLSTWEIPANLGDTNGSWVGFSGSRRAPEQAVAARVSFGFDQAEVSNDALYWDGLFVSSDPVMVLSDGFETGDLSNWEQ